MGDLCSLTRDYWIFSHWTTRELPAQFLFKGAGKEQVPNTTLEEKQCFSVELNLSSQDGWGGICDVSYPTSIPHAWLTAHLFPLGRFPPPPAPALAPLLLLSHRVVSDSLQPHGLVACQAPQSLGFPQARILEQVAIFFSRESSRPRNQTCISCIGRRILYH